MILYLDSSALVKLYIREAWTSEMRALTGEAEAMLCHVLGLVEVRAALAGALRAKRLAANDHAQVVDRFRADWPKLSHVGIDESLLERAAELAEGFGLRAYDSVHLAAADRVQRAVADFVFAGFDRPLNRAAKLLGMALPPFAALP